MPAFRWNRIRQAGLKQVKPEGREISIGKRAFTASPSWAYFSHRLGGEKILLELDPSANHITVFSERRPEDIGMLEVRRQGNSASFVGGSPKRAPIFLIEKEYQRKGLGEVMWRLMETHLSLSGVRRVWVNVENRSIIAFFLKHGGILEPRFKSSPAARRLFNSLGLERSPNEGELLKAIERFPRDTFPEKIRLVKKIAPIKQ